MPENPTTEEQAQKPSIIYWSSVYLFLVATLYQWGYWSSFNINIFEFMNLGDVAKAAAYPIASTFLFLALGVVVGEFTRPKDFMPSGGGADSKAGIFLRHHVTTIIFLYFALVAALLIYGPTRKWLIAPILIAIPIYLSLHNRGILSSTIKSEQTRNTILFLLSALPTYAYGHGVMEANYIISGEKYFYINPEPLFSKTSSTNPENQKRYIGKAGDQYFFYTPETHSILITPTNTKSIELIKSPIPKDTIKNKQT